MQKDALMHREGLNVIRSIVFKTWFIILLLLFFTYCYLIVIEGDITM